MADEPVVIDDVYTIRSVIAQGNKTQVCEVLESGTNRTLAMKLVIEGLPEPTKLAKADLKAEAAVMKSLLHPNIVRFEKHSSSRDASYILMEFFRAANVKAQLKSELNSLHTRARAMMESVCQALMYLHDKGWVHRDLKPENILLNRAGEAKLVDFSLAMRYSQGVGKMLGFGRKKVIQGTRTYIAPETILRKPFSPQTDIYSLGVTFFEILTGKTPFQGFTPQDLLQKHLAYPPPLASGINPNLTPEVDQLLIAMLAKKPKDRPQSMQEIYGEVRRIKLFVKDVMELKAAREQEAHAEKMSIASVLDSRTDAERTEQLRSNPELAEQHAQERRQRQDRRRPKQRAASKGLTKPEPAPAMMQPQQGFMPQPMMQPGMMPPPMMMPQPMLPQFMPQPMMPQFPQPGAMPSFPQMQPGQFAAPPAGLPPAPTTPPAAATPAPTPASPPPQSPPPVDPNSLEYMTELPDVL